ncbi:hypothetical protein RSOLAG22IIIB_14228 [Rhizoctonia solani]|uniref:Uncharacterized protein n=1 Tax=Rhizoctonia solani TaxID=456999 RepID=A0A0K6FWC7_9AGAM|nr:hypothetical protein RSOLAG22IIIB_14228 [Rhizoctonia solani]
MASTDKPKTVLAYIVPQEDLLHTARHSGLDFADSPAGFAWRQMAFATYDQFEPLGPVQLHFVGINKVKPGERHGMALVLGFPNQELEELPSQLLDLGVDVFHSQPRRLTRVGNKGYDWTIPKVDGTGIDDIIMAQQDPHKNNWSWFDRPKHV